MRVPLHKALIATALLAGCAGIAGVDGEFRERPPATPAAGAAGEAGSGGEAGAAGAQGGSKPPAPVRAVAAGARHTCAALGDGSVWCWGDNADGKSRPGQAGEQLWPAAVPGVGGAIEVAAGASATCALRGESGEVDCWGLGQALWGAVPAGAQGVTRLPLEEGAQAISLGGQVGCAITRQSGRVVCWGDNAHGQLGLSSQQERGPVEIKTAAGEALTGAAAVAVGERHACAIFPPTPGALEGEVRCWGDNAQGQLGTQAGEAFLGPVGGGKLKATMIAAGALHTCASGEGSVYCWGDDRAGQCATGAKQAATGAATITTPVKALKGDQLRKIALGQAHGCLLAAGGGVRCWGLDALYLLGLPSGPGCDEAALAPDLVTSDKKAQALEGCAVASVQEPLDNVAKEAVGLSAGWAHTCAYNAEGVTCWGRNDRGQLGDGGKSLGEKPGPVRWGAP